MHAITVAKPKSLSQSIEDFYNSLGITHPSQLDMYWIAEKTNVILEIFPIKSSSFKDGGLYFIVIDSRLTPQQQWQDFGHEMSHILLHGWLSNVLKYGGNQLRARKSLIKYQEMKADNFTYEFCIPTFMLQKMKLPKLKHVAARYVSEQFCVTDEFAYEQLTRFENRMVQC